MKLYRFALAAVVAVSMGVSAQAAVLLTVDLSVPNLVTVTSTTGAASASVVASDGVGIYLANFFTAAGAAGLNVTGTGTLTDFLGTSDLTPGIYRDTAADPGLNFWTLNTVANLTFTSGTQAFSGVGTFVVPAARYAELLLSNAGGSIYAPADDASDLPNATIIGEWRLAGVVPEPSTIALAGLGLVGLVGVARRRK